MSKKTFKDIGNLAASAFINIAPTDQNVGDAALSVPWQDQKKEPAEIPPSKGAPGRPRVNKRILTKSSQENLPENWTRATFILREDLLAAFKKAAALEGQTIKEAINDAIAQYLNGGNSE